MKNTITIVAASAVLLLSVPAFAQEGEGAVSGEASAEVSASGEASAPAPVETSSTSTGTAGQFGVGFDVTLVGVFAGEIVYQLNERMFISGLIGFRQYSPDAGDSETAFGIGAGVFYSLFHAGIGDFNVGARLMYTSADGAADTTQSQIDIEVPLRVQLRLNRHFAVHFDTGLALSITGDEGGITTAAPEATRFVIGAGDLFATGGFDIYF